MYRVHSGKQALVPRALCFLSITNQTDPEPQIPASDVRVSFRQRNPEPRMAGRTAQSGIGVSTSEVESQKMWPRMTGVCVCECVDVCGAWQFNSRRVGPGCVEAGISNK